MRRVRGRQQSHGALRLRAKAMDADLVIERERAGTDERRELAGGTPPREVHLEEAVLRVKKPERASDVLARGAADRGNAEPIALDLAPARVSPRELLRRRRAAAGWLAVGCAPRPRRRCRRSG